MSDVGNSGAVFWRGDTRMVCGHERVVVPSSRREIGDGLIAKRRESARYVEFEMPASTVARVRDDSLGGCCCLVVRGAESVQAVGSREYWCELLWGERQ